MLYKKQPMWLVLKLNDDESTKFCEALVHSRKLERERDYKLLISILMSRILNDKLLHY